jgi:hypothetical protein
LKSSIWEEAVPGLEVVDFTEKGLEVKFLSLDCCSWDIPLDDAM